MTGAGTMGTAGAQTLPGLLAALEARGPHPALVWYADEGRTELSGHVLANWIIKSANHLGEEIMLEPGEQVVLDLPPHWKRLVLAFAAWSLGATVDVPDGDGIERDVRVLATERVESDAAADADELLALHPVSLSLRFTGDLPALAHDWAQEVRGHADHLTADLADWSGPIPGTDPGHTLLIPGDGIACAADVLGAWLHGRGVVGPADVVTPEQAEAEGARAGT